MCKVTWLLSLVLTYNRPVQLELNDVNWIIKFSQKQRKPVGKKTASGDANNAINQVQLDRTEQGLLKGMD